MEGLRIEAGRLTGRSSTSFPIVHLERTIELKDSDVLHALEIRMRASAGNNLSVAFEDAEKINWSWILKRAESFPWRKTTPIVPGTEFQTYRISGQRTTLANHLRHIMIRPTDVAGATFEIESVRVIFRREHLAGIPSGVSFQGLSEVYMESIVSRAPEIIRMPVSLPKRPMLDLNVGTVDFTPVTFEVAVGNQDGSRALLLERTITTPYRWEPALLDLSDFADQNVTLELTLRAQKGALGFWGAPVVRVKDGTPERTAHNTIPGEPPQGVILIWADTLRADHLDAYGYPRETAPQLRQIASEGALFRNHSVQGIWTKVSTPSLLTSLYPTSHGVQEYSDRLPSSALTLAEVFRAAGYATLSYSSILFTGQFTNLHQGFEIVHEDRSLSDPDSSKTSREYTNRFLEWLEDHRSIPFFVFFHVSDPHDPYEPYPPYDSMWADPARAAQHKKELKDVKKHISDPLLRNFGMPSLEELAKAGIRAEDYVQHERDWYDGSIRAMDAEIGRLMERLRELQLDKKVLVIFSGDHGEEFLEHGRTFHGQSVYGELSGTPLILWMPGTIPSGAIIPEPVENIDVMPTILDISRLKAPAQMQGQSLLPLIHGKEWKTKPVITEKAAIRDVGGPAPRETEMTAISLDGWKLIHNTERAPGVPEFELYDAQTDPLNLHDVAPQHPEVVRRLAAELKRWRAAALAKRLKPETDRNRSVSGEEMERLRSLGYIQ